MHYSGEPSRSQEGLSPRSRLPLIVVGAGAAGLLSAIFAARRSARVLLLETRLAPGAKIRVSGGGRANLLPTRLDLSDFHTDSSRNTLRKILLSWPLAEVRAFFERELRLPLKDEPSGKVFPASDRSLDVVEALLGECRRAGASLLGGRRVERISKAAGDEGKAFRLECGTGEVFEASRVILATGGLSLPRTGSDGGGLALARSLGHSIRETYPALVPLIASDKAWGELAGVSLCARLKAVEDREVLEEREGDLLFTHRGFSGPVVLDLSRHFSRPGGGRVELKAAWAGSAAPPWESLLATPGKRSVAGLLREHLPRRLAERLLSLSGVSERRATSELRREERRRLVEILTDCPLNVVGTEGYAVAEVTGGGVPLEEVSPRSLQSRIVPELSLAGEMLDVVGHIGGFNFLWAWVTGKIAGEGAVES